MVEGTGNIQKMKKNVKPNVEFMKRSAFAFGTDKHMAGRQRTTIKIEEGPSQAALEATDEVFVYAIMVYFK